MHVLRHTIEYMNHRSATNVQHMLCYTHWYTICLSVMWQNILQVEIVMIDIKHVCVLGCCNNIAENMSKKAVKKREKEGKKEFSLFSLFSPLFLVWNSKPFLVLRQNSGTKEGKEGKFFFFPLFPSFLPYFLTMFVRNCMVRKQCSFCVHMSSAHSCK